MPSFPALQTSLRKVSRMGSAKAQLSDEGVAPLDVIFSCSVCGDIFTDIYRHHQHTVEGLSDGINPKERLVTRLYVATCCHVICVKHLDDGSGPPFHPAGTRPRASCPVCIKESGEDRLRDLYSVRGFKEGEYDPAIPKQWFSAPPMKLDGRDKDIEALRFQYLALIRYSKNITNAHKATEQGCVEQQKKMQSMQSLASEEQAKILSLEQELERLRPMEREMQRLHKLQARLPAIEHYLRLLPKLAKQNDLMQQRLSTLGFQMALEPIPNYQEPFPLDNDGNITNAGHATENGSQLQHTTSTYTGGTSITPKVAEGDGGALSSPQMHRPLKRQRISSPNSGNDIHVAPSSRDLMPPPSKPLSRIKSMRNIIPTIRKKFLNARASTSRNDKSARDTDVEMYENGQFEDFGPLPQSLGDGERPPTRHGLPEIHYMSGALPTDFSPRNHDFSASPSHLSPEINDEPAFTFRSPSPMKLNSSKTGALPVERSYIRLMDGLNRNTGLELGLRDPRLPASEHNHSTCQVTQGASRFSINEEDAINGHASIHQSSNDPSSSTCRRPHSLRQNSDDRVISDLQYGSPINPVTPAPARFQRPVEEADNVVSPFFESMNDSFQKFSRGRVAEREDSFNRSGDYQFHHQRVYSGRPDSHWTKKPSLNGLSFFNSPLNDKNEPIEIRNTFEPMAPARLYQARNLDSNGFIMRPESQWSSLLNGAARGTINRRLYSRQPSMHSPSAVPHSSNGRAPYSQTTRLPSATPSIVSKCSPVRTSPNEQYLIRSGLRSSQYTHTPTLGDGPFTPARKLFSSYGRRSIRR